jgi:serine/threonine protein phosphatase PrpC
VLTPPRISSHTIRGARHANGVNEDQLMCEPDVFAGSDACTRNVGLFGLFDGHGGITCAAFAAGAMPQRFRESEAWDALRGAVPGDATAVERVLVGALEHAFFAVAREFEAMAEAQNNSSGACGLVAAVCEGVVVIANVGDSKAIMYVREGDKQSVRSTGERPGRHCCCCCVREARGHRRA